MFEHGAQPLPPLPPLPQPAIRKPALRKATANEQKALVTLPLKMALIYLQEDMPRIAELSDVQSEAYTSGRLRHCKSLLAMISAPEMHAIIERIAAANISVLPLASKLPYDRITRTAMILDAMTRLMSDDQSLTPSDNADNYRSTQRAIEKALDKLHSGPRRLR